jgi:hypothetical protein
VAPHRLGGFQRRRNRIAADRAQNLIRNRLVYPQTPE